MGDFETVLHYPLVHLKDGEITVASLLLSVAIFVATWLAAALVDRGVRGLASRRGLEGGIQFALSRIARYLFSIVGPQ